MILNNAGSRPASRPDGRDPWVSLPDSASIDGPPWFAWHDGHTGLCVLGVDAEEHHIEGSDGRFEAVSEICSQLGKQPPGVPAAFVAFGFRRSARVLVPKRMMVTGPPGSSLVHPVAIRLEHNGPPVGPAQATRLDVPWIEGHHSWLERVRQARGAVAAGQLEKVVLARATRIHAPDGHQFDAAETLRTLRRQHPGSFCFAIQGPDGCFLGATPELLLRVTAGRIQTHAVAGTTRRGLDADEDRLLGQQLLASDKDRIEHRHVVDSIREALEPCCDVLDIPQIPSLIRLPHVQHLVTPITGTLRRDIAESGHALMIVAAHMHPTPAVGGRPRQAAADWLKEREPLSRGPYAAPIGWLSANGDGALAVAIRSAVLRGPEAIAWAGAGIVAASEPEQEWRETELKLQTIADALVSTGSADD